MFWDDKQKAGNSLYLLALARALDWESDTADAIAIETCVVNLLKSASSEGLKRKKSVDVPGLFLEPWIKCSRTAYTTLGPEEGFILLTYNLRPSAKPNAALIEEYCHNPCHPNPNS